MCQEYNNEFDIGEISAAILALNDAKDNGPMCIETRLLKKNVDKLAKPITNAFNGALFQPNGNKAILYRY